MALEVADVLGSAGEINAGGVRVTLVKRRVLSTGDGEALVLAGGMSVGIFFNDKEDGLRVDFFASTGKITKLENAPREPHWHSRLQSNGRSLDQNVSHSLPLDVNPLTWVTMHLEKNILSRVFKEAGRTVDLEKVDFEEVQRVILPELAKFLPKQLETLAA